MWVDTYPSLLSLGSAFFPEYPTLSRPEALPAGEYGGTLLLSGLTLSFLLLQGEFFPKGKEWKFPPLSCSLSYSGFLDMDDSEELASLGFDLEVLGKFGFRASGFRVLEHIFHISHTLDL